MSYNTPVHAKISNTKWFSKGENAGKWTVKMRFGGSIGSIDHDDTSNGAPTSITRSGEEVDDQNFLGASAAINYAFTDHFSVESSVGYFTSQEVAYTLTVAPNEFTDQGKISRFPITFAALFHPIPYGQINPYIGAGYHYTFVTSSYDSIEHDDTNGALFKAGFDFWTKSQYGFNFDIEHRLMEGTTDYTPLIGINLEDEVTYNPTTISVGLNYRF